MRKMVLEHTHALRMFTLNLITAAMQIVLNDCLDCLWLSASRTATEVQ